MVAAWLMARNIMGGGGYKLKAQVKKFLGYRMETWEEVIGDVRGHQIAPTRMAPYCADDALWGMKICQHHMEGLKEFGMMKVFDVLENPIAAEVLPHMEECGMEIDAKFLSQLYDEHLASMNELNKEFTKLTGADIGSNLAISKRLIDELGWWLPPEGAERGKSGCYSIAKAAREKIFEALEDDTPGMQAMELKIKYQTIQKIVSTYTRSLVEKARQYRDGRLRTSWNQTRTDTGRLSSSDPALQQLPIRTPEGKKVRQGVIAPEGWILYDRDYSGADLRMMAHLCRDERMINLFHSEDDNLHRMTSNEVGCNYDTGKVMNLGLIYEMSSWKLSRTLKIPEKDAEEIFVKWHRTYPGVRAYHRAIHDYARKHGYVKTITGRLRWIDGINSRDKKKRKQAERYASNCVDYETEALTQRGWVKGPELRQNDILLTKNIDTGNLEWQGLTGLRLYPDYNGELVHFTTRNFTSVSTPNHRWMVYNKGTNRNECRTSEEISVYGDHRIHRTGSYLNATGDGSWTDDEVRLIGWFLTDGTIVHSKKGSGRSPTSIRVMQSLRANKENCQDIANLLDRISGLTHGFYVRAEHEMGVWTASGPVVRRILSVFPDRVLTMDFLLSLSGGQCQVLQGTMVRGDGWEGAKIGLCCSSKRKADMFQVLGCMTGKAVSIKYRDLSMYSPISEKMPNIPKPNGAWYATILKRDKVQIQSNHRSIVIESRGVWCPQVPNTYFVARRKDSVFITGNTPDQGSVADIAKIAMRNLIRDWKSRGVLFNYHTGEGKAKLIGQVHDELLVELREDFAEEGADDTRRHMEEAVKLRVPLKTDGDFGKDWLEAH